MPAGQQVALQPALAEVLGEHLHHPADRAQVLVRRGQISRLPDAGRWPRRRACSRLDAVSSGPNSRKLSGLRRITSRSQVPEHPGRLGGRRRARARRRRSRGSRAAAGRAAAAPPLACGLALIRRSPRGRSARSSGTQPAVVVEQLLRPVGAQPLLQLRRGAPGSSRTSASGTWCARQVPSTCRPSTSAGRSSPSACAARSSASVAGARPSPSRAARALDRARSRRAISSSVAAIRWCTACGSSPASTLHDVGLVAVAAQQVRAARRSGIRASTVGLAIL